MSRTTRSTRTLSPHPDLDQLKRQAKELLDAFRSGDIAASAEVHAHYRDAVPQTFALHDAQLVLARAYGFDSWPKLKAHVDGITGQQFIRAAAANDLDQVGAMLKTRPDFVDAQWSYGDERRALHYAVMNRVPDMVRLLMQRGANARAGVHPHRDATTPKIIAIERGFQEIVAIIEEEERKRNHTRSAAPTRALARPAPPKNTVGVDAATRAAVIRGDTDWLRARHAQRPLVNTIDWNEGGLLTLAAANNQAEVLAFLLDLGFDPDERVRWSEGPDAAYSQGYPLWHCAATGKQAMAELLLQRGASPNVHVDSSGSPVYAAYSHRQWTIVDLLKRYRGVVTPDIVGLYRETDLARELLTGAAKMPLPPDAVPVGRSLQDYLLEYALSGGGAEIVRMALERVTWPRKDPRWFRMLARGVDFWNHIPWLRAGNPDFDRHSYISAFRLLVERCDPNVVGGFGGTALHEVAAAGNHVAADETSELARILLDAGARTDIRDEMLKSTPLGWACRWGRPELVKLFLSRGADPVESDAEPWATPTAWARKRDRADIEGELRQAEAR